MKQIRIVFISAIFIVISIICFFAAFAQEGLLGKIREHRQERRQEIVDKLSDRDISSAGEHLFDVKNNGLNREYKVYVPNNYKKNVPIPLVIFLHGGGGGMKEAFSEGIDKMADKYGFILAIPQGAGKKILGKTIGSWNSGNWSESKKFNPVSCCGYAGDNNIDDVGFISNMINGIENNYAVDEKRIYVTGISNGAMMSYRLACELSNKIAAVAVVAPPFVPETCNNVKPISIMHVQGTADPCALYNGGVCGSCLGSKPIAAQSAENMVNFWTKKDRCLDEPKIIYQKGNAKCVIYSQCETGIEIEFCTIDGGGHTWPGGNQYLPEEKIGSVSNDMSFDQMWEFLEKHTLNN